MAKGTEAIAYIGAFGIVAFGNNGICLHSGKCQKRQRIAGNREKGIWDSGESHSSRVPAQIEDFHARIQHNEAEASNLMFNLPLFTFKVCC